MDNSEQPVNGAITVESLLLEGFKEVERDQPFKVQELKEPLIGFLKEVTKGPQSALYHLETEKGLRQLRGCADLDSQMVKVKLGQLVAVFYTGEKRLSSGNTMYSCKVVAR